MPPSLDRVWLHSSVARLPARRGNGPAPIIRLRGAGAPADHGVIRVLQLGRALAALSVVMMHVIFPTEHLVGPIPERVTAILRHGYLGVDFFFVLSGFIIFYTNHAIHRQPGWAARYLSTRLARIYLPYLPIGIGLALVYSVLPGLSGSGQPWSWTATLTLIPGVAQPALGVAWTLTYELAFYLLALLFFRLGEPLAWASLWAMAILMRHVAGAPFQPPPDLSIESVLLNPLNLEFVFGMYAARIVIDGQIRSNLIFWAAGFLCIATFVIDGMDRTNSYIFGLGLACIIVPLIRLERNGFLRVGGWGLLLGDASYAMYLLHLPLFSVTSRLVGWLGPVDAWQVSVILGAIASIGAGIAYHLLYEKPVLHLVRQRLGKIVPRGKDREPLQHSFSFSPAPHSSGHRLGSVDR